MPDIHLAPIIQSSPSQMSIINLKSQGMDKMQPHFRSPAKPGDVPGVGRNHGLMEHHMKGWILNDTMTCLIDAAAHLFDRE